jgi:hypothetical protein
MFSEVRTPAARPSIERIERVIVEHEGSARDRELPVAATSASSEPTMVTAPKTEPHPIITQPLIERVIVERESSDHPQDAQPSTSQSHAGPVPASNATDAKSAPRPVVTPIIERIERIQEIPDQGQVARLGPAPMPQPRTTPSHVAPGPQPSAPPTIHVTIGRIEVRATPPPTTAKRASQPAPKMSLEEYLRSRSGDRR